MTFPDSRPPRTGRTMRGPNTSGSAPPKCTPDPLERLLSLLDGVKETGADQWMARSPCREDRTPSLSIKRADDRILIHDFGGASPDEVMRSLGLSVSDLFEHPLSHALPPVSRFQRKRHNQASEALKALVHECRVVGVLAEQMRAGFALDRDQHQRLDLAISRVESATELAA